MRAEAQHSILQNKFRKWFDDPVPSDLPLPEDADHSIEDPALAGPPFTVDARYIHRIRKRRLANPAKLLQLLFFGFMGALSFGMSVGATIYFMNEKLDGWYSAYWPSQSAVILMATVLGLSFGLIIEYVFLKRERVF